MVQEHALMTVLRNVLWASAAAAAALSLAGCASDIAQRGNLPTKDKLAELHPGSTTRDQVVKILGSPSSTAVFDERAWYYISARVKQVAFFQPDVLDQEVYVVRFDGNGVVKGIDHKNLKDGHDIVPVARETPAPGRQLSFFEQLVGNIGRFNSATPASTSGSVGNGPGNRPE
jgi:outer membrane protein assembly factor BamE (lipoprotein component of BamABCDE complex)